jgi:hypothetical protein
MYFSLPTIINSMYVQQLTKVILPDTGIQNIAGFCKQLTILTFYQVSSRLITLLKSIYSSVEVSDILVLTLCFKLITAFHIPSILKIPTDFTSYIIHIISICKAWILKPLQFSLLPFSFLIMLNIICQTMVYDALIHTDLDSLWPKFLYSLCPTGVCIIIQIFQSCKPI